MANFGVTNSTSDIDKTGALNYALHNIGSGFQVNPNTGVVSLPFGDPTVVYEFLFSLVQVAFADDIRGNGLSFLPTNKSFYGLRNTNVLGEGESTNPGDYTWYDNGGSFGTDRTLYYIVIGVGRLQLINGSISSPPVAAHQLPYNEAFQWYNYIPVTIVTSDASASVLITPTTPAVTYYPALSAGPTYNTVFGDNTAYQYVNQDTSFNYVMGETSATNVLSVPNVTINNVLNLTALTAAPATYSTGTITVADRTSWDPAGIGSGEPYVAFYNGTNWVKLG